MTSEVQDALVAALIEQLPTLVNYIRHIFVHKNPTLTPPTDAEIANAILSDVASVKVDDDWLAMHPDDSQK